MENQSGSNRNYPPYYSKNFALTKYNLCDIHLVQVPFTYSIILKHLGMNLLDAIVSIKHFLVHFTTVHGIGEMRKDQQLA